MRKITRALVLILTLAFVVSMLGACGSSTNKATAATNAATTAAAQTTTAAPEKTTAAPAEQKPVTLNWWVADPASWSDGYKQIIEEYKKVAPNVTVKLGAYPENYEEKLNTAIAANTPPDIYIEAVVANGATGGTILPLDDFMAKDGFDPNAIYFQPYFDMWCKYEGKTYALPRDIFSTVFVYNKKLFDEAGVAYPQDGWTLDQFLDTAKKLTDVKKKRWGVLFTDDIFTYFPFMWSFGGDIVNADGTQSEGVLNGEGTIAMFQYIQDLIFKYNVAPTPQQVNSFGEAGEGGSANIFNIGRIGMMPVERYAIGDYKESKMDIGVVSFPVNSKGEQWSYGSMPAWSISSKTKDPQAAWNFLKYAYGPEGSAINAKSGYFFPAVKQVATDMGFDKDPIDGIFFKQFGSANKTQIAFWWRRPAGWAGVYAPDYGPYWDAFEKCMLKKADVKKTLDAAAKGIDNNIADFKKKSGK